MMTNMLNTGCWNMFAPVLLGDVLLLDITGIFRLKLLSYTGDVLSSLFQQHLEVVGLTGL